MLLPRRSEATLKRDAQKKRAATARASAAAAKAWTNEVAAVAKTTLWRPRSTWLEEATGARCAEFVHVSSGTECFIRLADLHTPEQRAHSLYEQLLRAARGGA